MRLPLSSFPASAPALLLALAAILGAAPAAAGVLPGDGRFGLVGTGGKAFAERFGLRYYTLEGNYAPGGGDLFSSVHPANDPAPGFSVVREVAKLNVRNDSLGETPEQFNARLNAYARALAAWYPRPSFLRGAKPAFAWYRPDAAALARAEGPRIVEAIRREKASNPRVTGTVWEIGNEPNLFPAITPAEYAAVFEAFHGLIKAEDPEAVVAMGSLFMPEPAADLKARIGEEVEARMRAELETAGLYSTLVAAGFFDDLVRDVTETLLSRILALPTREYLRQTLEATSARPDLVTVHVYPFDDREPALDSAGLAAVLGTALAGVQEQSAAQGGPGRIWVTEFGNIEQGKDEHAVAARSLQLIASFQARPGVERWFHYKSTGADDQFALFSSGPPPLTRLAREPDFAPASGAFPCAALNAVGLAYYRASHAGAECAERISFAEPSSSRYESGASDIRVVLDAPSHAEVAVSYRVATGSAQAGDYSGGAGTLRFAPGETSVLLPFAAVDDTAREDSAEAALLVLHGPIGAALSADSLHAAAILDDDTASGDGEPPSGLLSGPARGLPREFSAGRSATAGLPPGLRLALPRPMRASLDLFDARGGFRGRVFEGELPAGRHVLPLDKAGSGHLILRLSLEETGASATGLDPAISGAGVHTLLVPVFHP